MRGRFYPEVFAPIEIVTPNEEEQDFMHNGVVSATTLQERISAER